MRSLMVAAVFAAGTLAGAPAHAQTCQGVPFHGSGAVVATYLSGDAADGPYAVRQYGGALVRQLPWWTPLGTHQALRLEASAGEARWHSPPLMQPPTSFDGEQASGGLTYTADVLPSSAVGSYAVCASAAIQGEYWRVDGLRAGGVTLPIWLSFGLPLGSSSMAVVPHASFGGYLRVFSGNTPDGTLQARGIRPFAETGTGLVLRAVRLDAFVRHEFKSRERLVLRAGLAL